MSSPEIQVSETPYPTNPAPTPAPQTAAPSAPPSPSPATSPLNQRASELAELGKARLQQQANDQIARVRAALTRAAGGFFEAGQGLRELQKRGVSESVGYAGFIELCETEFGLARSTAYRMVRAASALTPEMLDKLGLDRADALLELANATTADDTATILAGGTIRLWDGGPELVVGKATVLELRGATRSARAHAPAVTNPAANPGAAPQRPVKPNRADKALLLELDQALSRVGAGGKSRALASAKGVLKRVDVLGLKPEGAKQLLAVLRAATPVTSAPAAPAAPAAASTTVRAG